MLQEAAAAGSTKLTRFARAAPLAFEPATAEVREVLGKIGRNYVSSALPLDAAGNIHIEKHYINHLRMAEIERFSVYITWHNVSLSIPVRDFSTT